MTLFIFGLVAYFISQSNFKITRHLFSSPALLERPGLVASVICILTGSLRPLMGVAVVLIFLLRSSVNGIVQDLNLPIQEKVVLEDPTRIFS